jgi:hypothetical protein
MDMRFGTWNVRSLCRSLYSSIKFTKGELKDHLVAAKEVTFLHRYSVKA